MQKEIQLTDKTLLVVGLKYPLSKYDIKYEYLRGFDSYGIYDTIKLPQGDWQLIGIYPELTEEQCKMVVDYGFCSTNGCELFECYTDEESVCSTALESFQSLMERENITGYDKYAILIKSK